MGGADDAVGPDGEGEVGPVVVAFFQFLPGVLEDFLPGFVAEEFPQGGGGDLDAVVQVRFPRQMRNPQQFFAEGNQLGAQVLQTFEFVAVFGGGAVAQGFLDPGQVGLDFFELGRYEVVDDAEQGLVGQPVVVDPDGV